MAPAQRPAGAVLLEFADVWKDLQTRPFSFTRQLDSDQPLVLENLRQITSLRAAISKEAMQHTSTTERVERIEKYLEYLAAFAEAHSRPGNLQVDWTSPLAGQPDRHVRLPGISWEHAMTLQLYAAGLRQAGHEVMAAIAAPQSLKEDADGSPSGKQPAAADAPSHAQAASLLRRAAGVYGFLHQHLADIDSGGKRRQPELVAGISDGLAKMSLAEAQAVAAHRAELRGSSPTLVAALHVATADLLEQAAQSVKDAAFECAGSSEQLRKCLALGWSCAASRARRACAHAECDYGRAGSAVAGIDEAAAVLRGCASIANESNSWRRVWGDETAALQQARTAADQLRQSVHFQAIAKSASDLPSGKCIVSAIAYELPPVNISLFEV